MWSFTPRNTEELFFHLHSFMPSLLTDHSSLKKTPFGRYALLISVLERCTGSPFGSRSELILKFRNPWFLSLVFLLCRVIFRCAAFCAQELSVPFRTLANLFEPAHTSTAQYEIKVWLYFSIYSNLHHVIISDITNSLRHILVHHSFEHLGLTRSFTLI